MDTQARRLRELALGGRGDDARGRHLATLYALESAYRRGFATYVPNRDPAGWLMLLLDVVGAHAGWPPSRRLTATCGRFHALLRDHGLREIGARTVGVCRREIARRARLDEPPSEAALDRMSTSEALWRLGYRDVASSTQKEKHPQGRQVRLALRARLDAAWAEAIALEPRRGSEEIAFLAALPIPLPTTLRIMGPALARVDEDLRSVPFAVFYALLADARRGGRVWRPPDRFVDGHAYDRRTFEAAVGHCLDAVRSRKGRDRRSAALAELGLSTLFPATVARLDAWLETRPLELFWLHDARGNAVEQDWYAWANARLDAIAAQHRAYWARVEATAIR